MGKEIQTAEGDNPWRNAPEDLADKVAELISRILSRQFNAKVVFRAVSREEENKNGE